jgi:hypothetical protein
MRYLSPFLSDARGKLGGTVFSRNPYGRYTRAKTAPIQPRTTSQQAGRSLFATIAAEWRGLTPAARTAWGKYAAQLTQTDSLGQKSVPSGFQTFCRNSRYAEALGAATLPSPPTTPHTPAPALIYAIATIQHSTSIFTLGITPQPPFAFAAHTYIAYATPGLAASIEFGPRQFYRRIAHDFTLDHTYPYYHAEAAYLAVFPQPVVGQVVRVQLRIGNQFTGEVSMRSSLVAPVTSV